MLAKSPKTRHNQILHIMLSFIWVSLHCAENSCHLHVTVCVCEREHLRVRCKLKPVKGAGTQTGMTFMARAISLQKLSYSY